MGDSKTKGRERKIWRRGEMEVLGAACHSYSALTAMVLSAFLTEFFFVRELFFSPEQFSCRGPFLMLSLWNFELHPTGRALLVTAGIITSTQSLNRSWINKRQWKGGMG